MFNLKLGNESWQVELPLVVGEEVSALSDGLPLQSHGESLTVLTVLLDHCRTKERRENERRRGLAKVGLTFQGNFDLVIGPFGGCVVTRLAGILKGGVAARKRGLKTWRCDQDCLMYVRHRA